MEQIIRAVRNLVDDENLTFKRVAEMHGISWETVQKIYNGGPDVLHEASIKNLKQKIESSNETRISLVGQQTKYL